MRCAGVLAITLMADDGGDDILPARSAFDQSKLINDFHTVLDGFELMDYPKQTGKHPDQTSAPRPDIILLDLNMPGKDGREAIKDIMVDPEINHIPVIALTTSNVHEDNVKTDKDAGSSFMTKPVTFQGMCEVLKKLGEY